MANKFNALQDGLYYIRSISTADPNPGIGGSYVTASGPGQDLLAVPGVEKQAWAVEKNKDSDLYTIRYVDNGSVSQDLGFWYETFEENTRLALHAPGNFTTQLVDGTTDVYIIRPLEARPGTVFDVLVGVTEGDINEVVIQHITPPGLGRAQVKPVWKFYKV